jgi:hypothetical protein
LREFDAIINQGDGCAFQSRAFPHG